MNVTATTPAPWRWQKFGDFWCLVGAHRDTPIVLDVGQGGPLKCQLRVRDGGIMTRFDPKHADARLIAAAPRMLSALEEAVETLKVAVQAAMGPGLDPETHTTVVAMRSAIRLAREGVA